MSVVAVAPESSGSLRSTLDAIDIQPIIQDAIELWTTNVQYNTVLQAMNTNVHDVWKVQKEQSMHSRKVLSDTTKQFKKSIKNVEHAIVQLHNTTTSSEQSTSSKDERSNIMETNVPVPPTVVSQVVGSMEALSQECRTTIKLYQEEIDSLTRRCKSVEQEYTGLLSQLSVAADPSVLFHHCQDVIGSQNQQMTQLLQTIDSLNQELVQAEKTSSEYKDKLRMTEDAGKRNITTNSLSNQEREELSSLRKEVAEYEIEFRSLKNQDITIRKLEEKIMELQIEGEENIRISIESAKQEIALNEGRRLMEAVERETSLIAKVQTLELQLKSERVGREMTQNNLLIADDRVSNQEAVWEVQRNILAEDNVRVREALQSVTRERDELVHELNISKSSNDSMQQLRPAPVSTGMGAASMTGATGGVVSFQDLLLERNAYEAEVRFFVTCSMGTAISKYCFSSN
jgi:uncharacterized protein YukE